MYRLASYWHIPSTKPYAWLVYLALFLVANDVATVLNRVVFRALAHGSAWVGIGPLIYLAAIPVLMQLIVNSMRLIQGVRPNARRLIVTIVLVGILYAVNQTVSLLLLVLVPFLGR